MYFCSIVVFLECLVYHNISIRSSNLVLLIYFLRLPFSSLVKNNNIHYYFCLLYFFKISSTGSNPDLVQSNVAPISKSESPLNKSTESKPVKESIQPSGDTLPKTISSTIKTSDPKLPTTTDSSKIPEVSTIAGASDIKIISQKLELENISIKHKDSSHKIPRSSVVSPSAVVSSDGGGTHSPDTELELTNLRAEITTLHDQIEALKIKREEDKTRIQELERIKIQFTQLEENRRLMREQAAELQREIAQLKTVCFSYSTNCNDCLE